MYQLVICYHIASFEAKLLSEFFNILNYPFMLSNSLKRRNYYQTIAVHFFADYHSLSNKKAKYQCKSPKWVFNQSTRLIFKSLTEFSSFEMESIDRFSANVPLHGVLKNIEFGIGLIYPIHQLVICYHIANFEATLLSEFFNILNYPVMLSNSLKRRNYYQTIAIHFFCR